MKNAFFLVITFFCLINCSNTSQEGNSITYQELASRVELSAVGAYNQGPDMNTETLVVEAATGSDTITITFNNYDLEDGYYASGTVIMTYTHSNITQSLIVNSTFSSSSDIAISGKESFEYTADITTTITSDGSDGDFSPTILVAGTMTLDATSPDTSPSGGDNTNQTTLDIYQEIT